MRRILHIDMDAFFAAVEQKRRPDLIGKPVVIGGGGDPKKRGVVSTASYEAREYGIHSAMPLITAYKLCPHAIFLPVDYREYSRVSALFKAVLHTVSPVMEDVGIDEAFLDISSIDKPSEEISAEIKRLIFEATGLTCSIGIAPNKLLAKIASDLKKPDGLTVVSEKDIETMLWPLPVRKLWGIGPKTEIALKEMGIATVGELAALPLDYLIERFGNSYGSYLFEASRGIDDNPLVTHWEPKSSSREITFDRDVSNWQTIAKNLADLVWEISDSLKKEGYKGRGCTVKVRYGDFKTVTRAFTLEGHTNDRDVLRKAAFQCLGRIELTGKRVRLIGVRVDKLQKEA